MISTETAFTIAYAMAGSGPKIAQTTKVIAAIARTTGTKMPATLSAVFWIGARWTQIAAEFNGRTENSIKNRFYSTLRRVASEQVRLQNKQVNRETLKTENLLSYFETAR